MTNSTLTETFEVYCTRHDRFITEYKNLYDDVAVFSALPEQFINDADPVIREFIDGIKDEKTNVVNQQKLKAITGFIERFYAFTDSATAMFSEHQAMADQTILYLQDMARMKGVPGSFDTNYTQLLAPLEKLELALTSLQLKVDYLKIELELLRPVWAGVVEQLQ